MHGFGLVGGSRSARREPLLTLGEDANSIQSWLLLKLIVSHRQFQLNPDQKKYIYHFQMQSLIDRRIMRGVKWQTSSWMHRHEYHCSFCRSRLASLHSSAGFIRTFIPGSPFPTDRNTGGIGPSSRRSNLQSTFALFLGQENEGQAGCYRWSAAVSQGPYNASGNCASRCSNRGLGLALELLLNAL